MSVVRKQWNEKADEWAAFVEDDTSYWTRRLHVIADLSMKHVPRGRSLDVGCGPGLLVRLLTEAGFEAHGADLSENMVQKATALLAGLVPDPGARLHHCPDGGVPDDPAKDQFDLITAIGILEYIPDRHGYVRKLTSILRPGGYLILANTNGIRSLFITMALCSRVLRFWLKDNAATMRNLALTGIWSGGHVDRTHADWLYSADALDALAAKLGLELVDYVDLYNLRWLDRNPGNRTALGKAFARRWGWNHVGAYRKVGGASQAPA
jgi:2-polyprenyl-3-methyl-5-hydroxy-6-metoxy-1,4-benzoquinol methylase